MTNSDDVGVTEISDLIDKLTIQSLYLMEDKIKAELNIESAISNGVYHLAKSRYIMGQQAVSSIQLPTEESTEFEAAAVVDRVLEESTGIETLELKEKENNESAINPIKWFGVLVPQNLYKAQDVFKKVIAYIVEAANIQLSLEDSLKKISVLKDIKRNKSEL